MSNEIITLSGTAADVLYSLFFRGALLSGDLPSKSGTDELREMGFAETRYTATEYQKENHFTFLTSEGQKFAVEHLVNTRFGKQQYCTSMTLGIEIDTSAAQKEIDKLDQRIRDTVSFELIRNGVPFIKDATIASGAITVLDDDPGRKINLGVERYAVFLDGIEVKHVFTADDEKGEVIAAVPDERGYMTTENGEVKRHTLYGSVRIEPCQR